MSSFWVLVPYYNPCRYHSRLENFRQFKKELLAPALVIEVSRSGVFELGEKDADILIQLNGEDRLWQKERLINIGLNHLPKSVEYVAWLDADGVFESNEWVSQTIDQLNAGYDFVQPFSHLIHLPPFQNYDDMETKSNTYKFCEVSAGKACVDEEFSFTDNLPRKLKKIAYGHAWCSTVARMKQFPLYDKLICGGGDSVHLAAELGLLEVYLEQVQTSPEHVADIKRHYAGRKKAAISYVEGNLFHLYHGSLNNRSYVNRHHILRDFNFDPNVHLLNDPLQPLALSTAGQPLVEPLAQYFQSRLEDA